MTTSHQAAFWAHQLSLQQAHDNVESLSRSIANARVDLNPHQVDAALFAFRSPLSKGVILADEVGLGKTIEAGIVLLQKWAERKRRILLILPATLRNQWQQELEDKFFIPSMVMEDKTFRTLKKQGKVQPFNQDKVVICSYQFAAKRAEELKKTHWDMVVIDEAHRLRNVYKPGNKIAKALKEALANYQKILLTATPLQNSLLELYGLVSFVDEHVFGDLPSFKDQFINTNNPENRNLLLRERIKPVCTRTLRKQVLEYVPYTERIAIVQEFTPNDDEHRLYEEVSEYLRNEILHALPPSQRSLMTLVVRKLLASSTFAISQTLRALIDRLQAQLENDQAVTSDETSPEGNDFESLEELAEEWSEDVLLEPDSEPFIDGEEHENPAQWEASIRQEMSKLQEFAELADRIRENAKGNALIKALTMGLEKVVEVSPEYGQRKAVVFTESRRTQQYLFDLLEAQGFAGQVVLVNGMNNDPHSQAIYKAWKERHAGTEKITGVPTVDMRAALVEEFRERASILVATEAAAEGVNLQFCSLVVNYDLPWNPQRIEQRIGRCHRYGQKCDVVVVNFLNKRNEADQRVYQLLSEKFKLFNGVFGSSDEVLGALESGVDIEKRIAAVYQKCRTPQEIKAAFDSLQTELEQQIDNRMASAQQAIIDNFDEDVTQRLKFHEATTQQSLDQLEHCLYRLTRQELATEAVFDPQHPRFQYQGTLTRSGTYHFKWPEADQLGDVFYRTDHPLAQAIIAQAKTRPLTPAKLVFDYKAYGNRISLLEPYLGQSGWLAVSKLTIEAFDDQEFLVLAGVTADGTALDDSLLEKMLNLPAVAEPATSPMPEEALNAQQTHLLGLKRQQADERNGRFYDEETDKLERWGEDLKKGLKAEIEELDGQIAEMNRTARKTPSLTDKLELQKQLRELEQTRKQKRQKIYDEEDAVVARRDAMIARVQEQLKARETITPLFTVQWKLEN